MTSLFNLPKKNHLLLKHFPAASDLFTDITKQSIQSSSAISPDHIQGLKKL